MIKGPLVSIIIPVYGVEKYLPGCLDSVLKQTYNNLEIIVVNDASPGDVVSIVKNLQKEHKNLSLVDLGENGGLFNARVQGIKKAKGDYVAHIDGDDTVCIDYIERLVNRARETDADIVLGENIVYNEKSKAKKIYNSAKSVGYDDVIKGENLPLKELLRKDNFFWEVCGKLYSRKVIDKTIPDLEKINRHLLMGEDMLFNIHFFYYCAKFARTEFAFYNYLINEGSVTAKGASVGKKERNLRDMIFVMETAKTFMQEKGVYNQLRTQFRHIRNMQAAKYYTEVVEDFSGGSRKSLLRIVDELAFDKVGLKYEVSLRESNNFDDINHLIWKLESMNSIKTSGLKLLSNIKRNIKNYVR